MQNCFSNPVVTSDTYLSGGIVPIESYRNGGERVYQRHYPIDSHGQRCVIMNKINKSIKIESDILKYLEERAKKENRSFNNLVETILLKEMLDKTGRTCT